MVDDALIFRKLSELDGYFNQIKEYEKITVTEYSNDWKTQRIIYDKVDAEIVVGILKKDLKDFMSYKEGVINFIKPGNAA